MTATIPSSLRRKAIAAFGVGLILGMSAIADTALAQDATGNWATEGGKARVRVTKCGPGICGVITGLAEPNDAAGQPKKDVNNADAGLRSRPLIGVPILQSMVPDGQQRWKGSIYNAEDGKTYTAYFTLESDNAAKVEGCVLGGIVCRKQSWTRAR